MAPFYFEMFEKTIALKSGLLLSLRLTTYVLVSVIVIYWMKYPNVLVVPFLMYSFLTLSLPIIVIVKRWVDLRFLSLSLNIIQMLVEIIVVTCVIYITGNISSAYSALFILIIISAALVTNLAGTLGIASLISIAYACVVWFGLSVHGVPGSSNVALEIIFSSGDAAFYTIFLHILTYFLVAFVSGFLVERLKSKDRELADISLALRRAQLETDDILKHLNSGLLTIDHDGRIIFFNRAAKEILGFDDSEARGRDFREIFGSRLRQLTDNLLEVLRTKKQNRRSEIYIADESGTETPLGISTSLLMDSSDEVRGVIAIFQDLTVTKKLEEKIRIADRMAAVGELSAAIAHEIRNPLAAISGSVEVLRSELNLVGENDRLMALIVRESSRLNNILSDFLMYARSKRSTFTRVELCHLAAEVLEMLRHHPSYHDKIDIHLSTVESFVYIFGDEDQIRQILINLVVNACDAIGDKAGSITIKIENRKSREILFEVIDTGTGIDESVVPKLFTPFFSTKKDGTGLGLAIVQRLAGNLNIGLSVQSEPGKGTVFALKFRRIPDDSCRKAVSDVFSPTLR